MGDNPRERLLSILDGFEASALASAPFIHANYVKSFYDDENVDVLEATPEVYSHFGFDLIHRNCTPA